MYAVFFHAHQKLDRVARRHLDLISDGQAMFPSAKEILHFEGQNGPDSTKLKKDKNVEQPWHFIDPFDPNDKSLEGLITLHFNQLVLALKSSDSTRAAFEASWLAHAIVDGLTPAHHYPYEKELEDLRGEDKSSRNSLTSRVMVKGETRRDTMRRSLQIIGPKGLLMTHTMFEAGAYSVILPLRLMSAVPSPEDIEEVETLGLEDYFRNQAKEVAVLGLYDSFYEFGWTPKLAGKIKRELAPRMVKTITLSWYLATKESSRKRKKV